MEPFELSIEELRARRGTKWTHYPPDVLPAWVADMDYRVPDCVQDAISRLVEQRDYGYGARLGDVGLAAAFSDRMADCFGWRPNPDQVLPTSELIQAMFAATMAFSDPGEGVIVQTPIYPPFLMTIQQTGRRQVDNPLVSNGSRFEIDFDGLKRAIDRRTRLFFFCNPHNPTGRVFERRELEAVAQFAIEHDLIVVADEIHADLIYPGHRHLPFAALGPEVAARTITITSATKSFNIPGLRTALMHFGSADLQARFHKVIPERLIGQVNVVGIDATVAAWRHGQPWLDAVREHLTANRARLDAFFAAELPSIKRHAPEGTYLTWLDCRALELPTSPYKFFLEKAKVGLNDGAEFGTNGETCVRLNFATSAAILDQILERMAQAVRDVA